MRKITKVISSVLCVTSLITMFSFNVVFAQSNDSKSAVIKEIKLDKNDELDKIVMNSDAYKKRMADFPDAKRVSKTESYVKVDLSKAVKNQKTQYTKDEYLKEISVSTANTLSATTSDLSRNYGWMRVSLSSYLLSGSQYEIEFAYTWLTQPYFTLPDAVVIGADSNFSIDTSTVWLGHHFVTPDNQIHTTVYTYYGTELNCVGANTYGANVPMELGDGTRTITAYGSMTARGYLNSSTAKYFGSYGHRQVSLSNEFSFDPVSLLFSFSFTPSYDEAALSNIVP